MKMILYILNCSTVHPSTYINSKIKNSESNKLAFQFSLFWPLTREFWRLKFTTIAPLSCSLPLPSSLISPPWTNPGPESTVLLQRHVIVPLGGVPCLPRARSLGPVEGHGCVQVRREGQLQSWASRRGQKDSHSHAAAG